MVYIPKKGQIEEFSYINNTFNTVKCMKPTPDPEITIRILGAFQNTPVMNIEQVAKSAKTTTITATKHLSRLAKKGTVREYPCGRNRIFVAIRGAIV